MITAAAIFYGLAITMLLVVAGARPYRTTMSRFELERRAEKGDDHAKSLLRREDLLHDIFSLQHALVALLLVTISALAVILFHWTVGFLTSLFIALEHGAVARLSILQRGSQKLYERYEPSLLNFVERFPTLFSILRSVAPVSRESYQLESREELLHLVSQSGSILTGDERKMILHGLQFDEQLVSDVMTPRTMIKTVLKKELLGPLVLDDLHKTGHTRFPVIDKDVDHVVGMLYVQNLLLIDTKKSVTAEKAMEPTVYYIRDNQTLNHAIASFIKTHHHLFIVINEFRETVGVISLEDVIETLLGREIIDEFEAHDDPRLVASRNTSHKNEPKNRHDV